MILYFYYFNNKNIISQSRDIKYTWRYLLMPLANESFCPVRKTSIISDQCFDSILFLVFVEANNKTLLFLLPFYMETYPNLVSVLNTTFDKFSSDCSVNHSRFSKLYGTICNSVLAKNQPRRLRRASKPLWRAIITSLRGSCQSLRRSNQSLERTQNNHQQNLL